MGNEGRSDVQDCSRIRKTSKQTIIKCKSIHESVEILKIES